MQLSYKILLSLDSTKVQDGLTKIYQNAISLKASSEVLAKQKMFATATAISLLSLEELIKATCIFLFRVGVRDEQLINYGFKKFKEHQNVHQTRLKLAEILIALNTLIDIESVKAKLLHCLETNPELYELNDGESIQDYIKRICAAIPLSKLVDIRAFSQPDNIDKIYVDGWLSTAQKIKEKSLYVDFEDEEWLSPADIKESDYLNAKKHVDQYFLEHSKVLNQFIEGDDITHMTLLMVVTNYINLNRQNNGY